MLRLGLPFAFVLAISAPCALGQFPPQGDDTAATDTIDLHGAKLGVSISSGDWKISHDALIDWVRAAANSVAEYYGRFPLSGVRVRIVPFDGSGVRGGRTFGFHGGFIRIRVGIATTQSDLSSDWMMTHEFVHLAFPDMSGGHHWIEEGSATYVEPIARIQTGRYDAPHMWADLVRDVPKGEPQPGDEGLDHTHTWGRTYWGGALFCLVADVNIRRATHNKKGLQDALRGVLDAGGDIRQDWSLTDAFAAADRASGTTVLTDLYNSWKDKPVGVDLNSLWQQLGVQVSPGSDVATFDDNAPLAAIRRAITQSR